MNIVLHENEIEDPMMYGALSALPLGSSRTETEEFNPGLNVTISAAIVPNHYSGSLEVEKCGQQDSTEKLSGENEDDGIVDMDVD